MTTYTKRIVDPYTPIMPHIRPMVAVPSNQAQSAIVWQPRGEGFVEYISYDDIIGAAAVEIFRVISAVALSHGYHAVEDAEATGETSNATPAGVADGGLDDVLFLNPRGVTERSSHNALAMDSPHFKTEIRRPMPFRP